MDPQYYAARSHEKMKDVLMNPDAKGPEIHYYMIRGGSKQNNVTVWQKGTVDGEYIKTYGHYHVGKLGETYWVVWGEGVAVLQKRMVDKNGKPIDDEIEDLKIISVKTGDKVYMPPDYGHLLVNTGKTYFVTIDDSPVDFLEKKDEASMPGHADYEPICKMQGFAYYVIEKNGKPSLVRNPNYKKIPEVKLKI